MFRVPTFNLTCAIWWRQDSTRNVFNPLAPNLINVPCNLQMGPKKAWPWATGQHTMYCLLPALTNVRSSFCYGPFGPFYDVLECPQGSRRYYMVYDVDDVSKGFPTEYRVAFITWAAGQFQHDVTLQFVPIPIP